LEGSQYHRFLRKDPNFKRWVSSVEEASPNTTACYFRRVGRVCTDLGKKPADLEAMNKQEAKVFLCDLISYMGTCGSVVSPLEVPRVRILCQ
jgi:hypothetical protein